MKERSPRNKTLNCDAEEIARLSKQLIEPGDSLSPANIVDRIVCGDTSEIVPKLPTSFADLLILDPPYNRPKNFNGHQITWRSDEEYQQWFNEVVLLMKPIMKPTSTVYVCSDWQTSLLIAPILDRHFRIRNRITWERGKGRGANANWKNDAEDIWFCTISSDYYFDTSSVKTKRKVIAPYRIDGAPKDWTAAKDGNYRLTFPSNIWTDMTVPFWSMPENTDHPAQKPEKLIAKFILASCPPGGLVFDPFLGSGTSAVVAKKLGRRFCGVELDRQYCCWALKRLELAEKDSRIQGYEDGVFWERNSRVARPKSRHASPAPKQMLL